MRIREHIEGDIFVEFAYKNERLSITLESESKGGCTTFLISEEGTDKLKAMLFCLDTTFQKAKERQAKKSLNRSLWDEARKLAGVHPSKVAEIYQRLKDNYKEFEQDSAGACARDNTE